VDAVFEHFKIVFQSVACESALSVAPAESHIHEVDVDAGRLGIRSGCNHRGGQEENNRYRTVPLGHY